TRKSSPRPEPPDHETEGPRHAPACRGLSVAPARSQVTMRAAAPRAAGVRAEAAARRAAGGPGSGNTKDTKGCDTKDTKSDGALTRCLRHAVPRLWCVSCGVRRAVF